MTRLTFLRRIGRPVAIVYPVFAAVAVYFAARAEAAAWGGAPGEAVGALLLNALLYAPLYFAPYFAQRSGRARVGGASLLLPAVALQALYVSFGALVLRSSDGIEAWTAYLVGLACLIVLGAAMAALLWPDQPPERTPEPTAAAA